MSSSEYWTVSSGIACRNGWTCRECRKPIVINTPFKARDGRKLRLFYHPDCFSGDSDPRTQRSSSFKDKRFKKVISKKAPNEKGFGKWSTSIYGTQSMGNEKLPQNNKNGGSLSKIIRKSEETKMTEGNSRENLAIKEMGKGNSGKYSSDDFKRPNKKGH